MKSRAKLMLGNLLDSLCNMTLKKHITIICILNIIALSSPAFGKKMYKYQSKNGHWIYTDQKPVTNKPIETKQLNTKIEWVKLISEKKDDRTLYYAYSEIPAPVEIQILIKAAQNIYTIPQLPAHFSIEQGKSAPLFEVFPNQKNKPSQWSYEYNIVIGPHLKNYPSIINYLPPIKGSFLISQAFNGKATHFHSFDRYAVDIVMPIGTPIYAARKGKVIMVDNDFYKNTYGTNNIREANQITILHDDGSMAMYAHLELEKAQVSSGMDVKEGQLIGYSGNTGYSSAPHLHFAILYNNGENVSVPFKFLIANKATEPREGNWVSY